MASATPTPNHASPQRPHASSSAATATSPPSKRDLKSWWKGFKSTPKHQQQETQVQAKQQKGIFGVELRQSITYANVAISLIDENGQSYIYGYVPIVVAKCGVYLKEKATGVEGIFRLSGSEKRIKELKQIFDSPDRYGKGLVWDGYTVHDAATVLRRYLNDLPEPVVPLDLYEKFRAPLRGATMQAVGDTEGPQFVENFDERGAIHIYQKLITELPPLNRQLLLYILDLLAVFAAKSDENRMNSQNLAAIFQPGTLSHPAHAMAPAEYRLNQCVIIFLIENQDHFLIGMHGTAADEQTKRDVESGVTPEAPSTPTQKTSGGLGRSASNASAGADNVRKEGQLRRNQSVSSRKSTSRNAEGSTTPTTPISTTPTTGGLARSNTLPSKRSPALAGSKFRKTDGAPSDKVEPMTQVRPKEELEAAERNAPRITQPSDLPVVLETTTTTTTTTVQDPARLKVDGPEDVSTPSKERNLTSFFQKSPSDGRQPNKLKKKQRLPGSLSPSAQSSNASLSQAPSTVPSSGLEGGNSIEASSIVKEQENPLTQPPQTIPENAAPSRDTITTPPPQIIQPPGATETEQVDQSRTTPAASSQNGGTEHDASKTTHRESQSDSPEKKKHWNILRSHKEDRENTLQPNEEALASSTSLNSSSGKPRKSFTGESSEQGFAAFDSESKDSREEGRGPMKWIKSKYREHRNKSPSGEGERERERASLSEKLLGRNPEKQHDESSTDKEHEQEPEKEIPQPATQTPSTQVTAQTASTIPAEVQVQHPAPPALVDTPKETPKDAPQDIPQEVPERIVPQVIPTGTPEVAVPSVITEEITQEAPTELQQDAPKVVEENKPIRIEEEKSLQAEVEKPNPIEVEKPKQVEGDKPTET